MTETPSKIEIEEPILNQIKSIYQTTKQILFILDHEVLK